MSGNLKNLNLDTLLLLILAIKTLRLLLECLSNERTMRRDNQPTQHLDLFKYP